MNEALWGLNTRQRALWVPRIPCLLAPYCLGRALGPQVHTTLFLTTTLNVAQAHSI